MITLSDGAKQPTQSDKSIHPRACELLLGLFESCLQIWQYISSLISKSINQSINLGTFIIIEIKTLVLLVRFHDQL